MPTQPRISCVRLLKNQRVITDKCFVAESFWTRFKGLIGTRSFEQGQGMLFPNCNDIHMWFMSIAIDVVFLREDSAGNWIVTSVRESLRPWKPLPARDGRASATLELPEGTVRRHAIAPGDGVCISSP